MRMFQKALLDILGGIGLLGGCGGDLSIDPTGTPAAQVKPDEIVEHYCPPDLPKADLRRIGIMNNQTAFKVWCCPDDLYPNPDRTCTAYESKSWMINYGKYYLCVDNSGSPSGSFSAQLHKDENGYYVDCQ